MQEISWFNLVFFHYNKKLQATCHINFLHILQYFFMKYFLFGCWIMFSWQAIMMIYLQTCYEVLTCTLLDYVLLASNHDKLTCQSWSTCTVETYSPAKDELKCPWWCTYTVGTYSPGKHLHAHDDVLTCPWWCTYIPMMMYLHCWNISLSKLSLWCT